MADPDEVMVLAREMSRIFLERAGNFKADPIKALDNVAKKDPVCYHKILEESERLIDVLDKHRQKA